MVVFRLKSRVQNFWHDESAQGITEYGAVLAMVAVLVAITFGIANGSLMPALSNAFSAVGSILDNMAAEASSAS
jgi:Flp pilus assembly pilin Flp